MPAKADDLIIAARELLEATRRFRNLMAGELAMFDARLGGLERAIDRATTLAATPRPHTLADSPVDVPDVQAGRVRSFTTTTVGELLGGLESTGFAAQAIDRRLRDAEYNAATPGRDSTAGTEPGRGEGGE